MNLFHALRLQRQEIILLCKQIILLLLWLFELSVSSTQCVLYCFSAFWYTILIQRRSPFSKKIWFFGKWATTSFLKICVKGGIKPFFCFLGQLWLQLHEEDQYTCQVSSQALVLGTRLGFPIFTSSRMQLKWSFSILASRMLLKLSADIPHWCGLGTFCMQAHSLL
jgi:hypothetical protein